MHFQDWRFTNDDDLEKDEGTLLTNDEKVEKDLLLIKEVKLAYDTKFGC